MIIAFLTKDRISIVLNYAIVLLVIPFTTLVAFLMQIYVSGDEFAYQLALCIPAITAFSIAGSLALRRSGYTKSGFFVKFVGPALFSLLILLDYV